MSQNALIGIVVAVVVIGGGAWWFTTQSASAPAVDTSATMTAEYDTTPTTPDTSPDTTPVSTAPAADTTPAPTAGTYTMVQISAHKSASSCWSLIDGNVYDLTAWIGQHPGGQQAIKGLCGIDGTAAFHGQHGDAKKQADMLATMKIGVLAR